MERIVAFRVTATGFWSYHFFLGNRQIGKVSSYVGPNATVRIEGNHFSWYSTFQMDTTIVPGTSRRIRDNRTGMDLYRIIYCEPGFYRMIWGENQLLVERRNGAYLFGSPGMPVLAMSERIESWPWTPERDFEPFFQTTVFEGNVSEELLMTVLSFPALRFF